MNQGLIFERLWYGAFSYEASADSNTASNRLAADHAALTGGEDALAASMTQEPLAASNRGPA